MESAQLMKSVSLVGLTLLSNWRRGYACGQEFSFLESKERFSVKGFLSMETLPGKR